jgi:hypothetical protein
MFDCNQLKDPDNKYHKKRTSLSLFSVTSMPSAPLRLCASALEVDDLCQSPSPCSVGTDRAGEFLQLEDREIAIGVDADIGRDLQ